MIESERLEQLQDDMYKTQGDFTDLFSKMYPTLQRDELSVRNITIVTTEKCNLNCTYCYQKHKTGKAMTFDVARKAIDYIFSEDFKYFDLKKTGGVVLDFIGGEPFANVELMQYVLEYWRKKAIESEHAKHLAINYMASVSTNGTLLHTPKVYKFIQKNGNRLSLGITIDGDKTLHDSCRVYYDGRGSYDDVVKNIKMLREDGIRINSTKVTFAPENINYINSAIPHLFDLGIVNIAANCVFENVWKPEDAKTIYKELIRLADYMVDDDKYKTAQCSILSDKKGEPMSSSEDNNWCGGTGSMLCIGTDGRFYPCLRYMEYCLATEGRQPIVLGNINKGINVDHPFLKECEGVTRSSQSPDKCMTCKIASGCAWCSGFNYDYYGTINKRATFICDMHKAECLASYYYYYKLYKKYDLDYTKYKECYVEEEDIKFLTGGSKDEFIEYCKRG